jgi:hypothetical protein
MLGKSKLHNKQTGERFKIMRKILWASILISSFANAQAIYDANGQYKGYSQTSPSGVTTIYNAQGQSIGSSQVDNGQTNYYSPNGTYRGTNTAIPAPPQPNTTINTPRQPSQPPTVKGW